MIVSQILSRTLAVFVLLGFVLLFFVAVILPLKDWRAEQFASSEEMQFEQSRLAASFDRLTLERDSLSTADGRSLSWVASTEGEAAAQIQTTLAEAAATSGISFRSVTPLPQSRSATDNRITFRLEFEADLSQLTQFLSEVEYATPALPISRATVRRLVRPGDQTSQPVIFAQLDVSAPVLLGDGS